ncbi:MAG: SAM-dependent methyltransferase [Pseudomonadota bacterium]
MNAKLTDPAARKRAHTRATRIADETAWFVHTEAAVEIKERLAEVNRSFTNPLIIGGQSRFLDAALPNATRHPEADRLTSNAAPHDLVVHFMNLHWADDPVGQLVQSRLCLDPDGLFLAISPGGETLSELRSVLAQAETEITGGLSPRVLPMGELRDLGALLMRAGFALPVADSVTLDLRYSSFRSLTRDLRAIGETNALAARLRHPSRRAIFERAEALYREHFADKDGHLKVSVELIVLTGWAPADTQPQPLRPGSAKNRLADALGTQEAPLNDPARPKFNAPD